MDIKKFENYDRYSECLNIIKNSKEGDILSNDVIYNYVEYLNDKSNIHSESLFKISLEAQRTPSVTMLEFDGEEDKYSIHSYLPWVAPL